MKKRIAKRRRPLPMTKSKNPIADSPAAHYLTKALKRDEKILREIREKKGK